MSNSRIGIWVLASRPKTLWAAIAPVIIGTAMAVADDGGHVMSALAAGFGAVMIQIGTNFVNDYYDFKKGSDRGDRLGPTRVTQAGLVSPEAMKRAIIIAFGLAFVAGIYLVFRGGWPIVAIGLCSIIFGILYTAGPFSLSYLGLADIFVLVFFGPVAVAGTYYVQTLQVNSSVIIAGLAPGLFSMAILMVNNYRDIESDKRAGKRTLAVRFGKSFARVEYLLLIVLAGLLPAFLVWRTENHHYALFSTAVIFMAIPTIKAIFTKTDGPALNSALAGTGRLLLVYSLLFSIGWLI